MDREYRTHEGKEGIEDIDGKSEGKKSLGRFRLTIKQKNKLRGLSPQANYTN
jgi:hypothetical protein